MHYWWTDIATLEERREIAVNGTVNSRPEQGLTPGIALAWTGA
jgi:hypothetical protein